jgi:aminopeptidase N
VTIEADDSQRITGSGSLTKIEQTPDETRIWTFEGKRLRDVAFVASNSLRALEQSVGGIVVRSWYPSGATSDGAANLATAASAVADYTKRFGLLPFDEVDVVLTPGLFGGMEYPGVVFIDRSGTSLQGVPVLPELLEFAGFDNAQSRYVIGHEVAHQWWYASVGSDQIREPWLDEALAEVAVITWLRRVEGDDHTWRMTNLLDDPAADHEDIFAGVNVFNSVQDYTASIYRGGASALLELRERVGSQRFDQILRTYHENNRLRLATGDDFIDAIREVAGNDAAQSFAR